MSTVSAGGFSTYNASAAHFESTAVEAWMTFFMILTGGNYGLYYQAWQKGAHVLWRNTEFKAYLLIIAVAAALIGINLMDGFDVSAATALRYSSFQSASIATTGFVSADYDRWPSFSKGILLLLMISGGCAGLATMLYIAQGYVAVPNQGTGADMDAIAAVIIGGLSVAGGKGNVVGTLLGMLFFSVLANGMNLLSINTYAQSLVKGALVLIAVYIDVVRTSKAKK